MAQAPIYMAESNRSGPSDSSITQYGHLEEEIREETESQDENKQTQSNPFCDLCFVLNFSKISALYLCYLCKKYMCGECYERHDKSHRMVELESKRGERETTRREFLVKIRKERTREDKFEIENVTMVDRVNVKHIFDPKDCYITGVCGLNNTRWVVSDYRNYCIKLFSVGSNILQRCIRFGSQPWGVTEITVKSEPTEQGVMSTSDISVISQEEPDKRCMLAVTSPRVRRILIIDVTQNPAIITNSIETEKHCHSIHYSGNNVITLCTDGGGYRGGPWFVLIMSKDGVTIKNINTNLHLSSWAYIAVCHRRLYITDTDNHTVLCMNYEGTVVSQKTIEGSVPQGISIDPDTNNVFICAWNHDTLYRLDPNLESFEPLFHLKSVNSDGPFTLCLYRDKLYVGHGMGSDHRNFVSVVRVL